MAPPLPATLCCALALLALTAATAAEPAPAAPPPAPDLQPPAAQPTPSLAIAGTSGIPGAAGKPWYFAVSGDSRDCGDVVMPKIAAAIESRKAAAPVELYIHLGDFRRLYDVDCDIAKRWQGDYDCVERPAGRMGDTDDAKYLDRAWPDFIEHQIAPFGATPVFLALGNHELVVGRTREDVRSTFRRWLTQEPIHHQRIVEAEKGLYSVEGETYYHFIVKGVDFIVLDNADDASFAPAQIAWLEKVLAADAQNPAVRTIVANMHAALPYSKARGHAMDASCQGLCSGEQVYDLLVRAQAAGAPAERRKHVYVFASHAHLYMADIFDQPEHSGQVLPGWLVGTAGAEQFQDPIRYGYLEVAVAADGSLDPRFREVTRDMPPPVHGSGGDALTEYCFTRNRRHSGDSNFRGTCACGAAH